jgi:recombinational DNA repair protein (RecF pathway)
MAEQCEMIIGFLVPHRCEHPALGRCARCGRGYCEEHIQVTQEGLVCLACQQGLAQPVALPITARTFTDDDLAAFDTASQWDVEDNDMFSDLS